MDSNKDNCLIKLLLETKTKPNFTKYTLEKLIQMYLEFIENKNNICDKLFLEKEYSKKTIDILNSICYDVESVENLKIYNLIFSNEHEFVKKKILINCLNDLWKKIPIIDECGEKIDCVICLNYITNCDNISFLCEHRTHSTCFFNYLFTNLKNNSDDCDDSTNDDLIKLFRCPNCRNGLTDTIIEHINEYTNENMNDNLNLNFEQQYEDELNNFILQEYDLFSDNIGDQVSNVFLGISNNSNLFSNYINFMTNPNIIMDNKDKYNYNDNDNDNYSTYSDSSNDIDSIDDDNN